MSDNEKCLVAWFFFSCAAQALPEPRADDRWYGFFYRFVHLVGLNFRQLAAATHWQIKREMVHEERNKRQAEMYRDGD